MSASGAFPGLRASALREYERREAPGKLARGWRFADSARFLPPSAPAEDFSELMTRRSPSGPVLVSFSKAKDECEAAVKESLERSLERTDSKLELLNLARWQDGLLVLAPAGKAVEKPVEVAILPPGGPLAIGRLLLVARKGSSLNVFFLVSGGPPAPNEFMLNLSVDILAEEGAAVRFACSQELAGGAVFYQHVCIRAAAGARVETAAASFGGSEVKADFVTLLEGPGASSLLSGVSTPGGAQRHDHHAYTRHSASGTQSRSEFRAVVGGRARSTVSGLVTICPEASNCEAWQGNRNLMLSRDARADSIPELEIMNNEVKCSHGSATGPLDLDQVYYLKSRGIPETEAARMLTAGFVEPVISAVPEPLHGLFAARFPGRAEEP